MYASCIGTALADLCMSVSVYVCVCVLCVCLCVRLCGCVLSCQILERTVTISALAGDDVLSQLEESVSYRQYTLQEVDLLARMSGLEVRAQCNQHN